MEKLIIQDLTPDGVVDGPQMKKTDNSRLDPKGGAQLSAELLAFADFLATYGVDKR